MENMQRLFVASGEKYDTRGKQQKPGKANLNCFSMKLQLVASGEMYDT